MAGPIRISVLANASAARRDLDGLGRSATTMGDRFARAGRAVAVGAGVGLLAAAAVTAKLGVATVRLASDAEQSLGATETVFGRYADNVTRASEKAATSVGLSANEYRESANLIGSLLGNQGVATDQLAGKTDQLVRIGSDLAATFGGTTRESVEALGSAFKGEFDPLERYGISLKQSTVNTEALRVANVDSTSAFESLSTAQQTAAKQQATTNLILGQSAKASGAFARETNTLAGQQQRLTAQTQNLGATIGTGLTPGFTTLAKVANRDVLPPLQALAEQYAPKAGRALGDLAEAAGPKLAAALTNLPEAFERFRDSDASGTLSEIAGSLADLGPVASSILPVLNDGLTVTSTVLRFAADNAGLVASALPFLAAGFLAVKTAQAAGNVASVAAVPIKLAEIGVNRQLAASNRALVAARSADTAALRTNTAATAASASSATGAAGKISKLGLAARGAAGLGGIGALAAGASTSNDALSTLANVGGGAMLGFSVGGPIGAAIGGGAGLLLDLASNADTAKASVGDLAKNLEGFGSTLDPITGKATEASRALAYNYVAESGILTDLGRYGIGARDLVNALVGVKGAMDPVNTALATERDTIAQTQALRGPLIAQQKELVAVGTQASLQQARALQTQIDPLNELIGKSRENLGVIRAARQAIREETDAQLEKNNAIRDYSGQLGGLPKNLRTQITADGLEPTRAGIAQLAQQYNLTPKQVRTLIGLTGKVITLKSINQIRQSIENVDQTKANLSGWLGSLTGWLGDGGRAAQRGGENVRRGAERAPAAARAPMDGWVRTIGQGMSKGTQTAARGGESVRDAAVRAPNAARVDLGNMSASVSSGLANVRGAAASGGASVGVALKQGIEGGFAGVVSSLVNTAASAVNAAVAAAKRAAQSRSPSRKMMREGRNIGLGLVVGMGREESRNRTSGRRLVEQALRGAEEATKRQPALTLGLRLDETYARSRSRAGQQVDVASDRVKRVNRELEEQRKALGKAKESLSSLRQAADAMRESVTTGFRTAAFGEVQGEVPEWLSGAALAAVKGNQFRNALIQDAARAEAFKGSLRDARRLGLSGGLLQEVAGAGDAEFAAYIASLGRSGIRELEALFEQRQAASAAAGRAAGCCRA